MAQVAVMRPVPFSPIMKISLDDKVYAYQSKNAPQQHISAITAYIIIKRQ